MDIRAAETGIVRLFHIDLPAEAVHRFTHQAGTGEWPLQYALGADRLRTSFVDVIDIKSLGGMSLSSYLAEAYDLSGKTFEETRPQIDALRGHAVALPSQAFDRTEQTLNVRSPLRWIGTFEEPDASKPAAPLRSEASKGAPSGGDAPGDTPPKTSPLLRALAVVVLALIAGVVVYLIGAAG